MPILINLFIILAYFCQNFYNQLTRTILYEKYINSGRLVFKLNGKTLKGEDGKALYVDVVNGIANTTYTIPAKTKAKAYTLTAVFTDVAYERAECEAELVVAKA